MFFFLKESQYVILSCSLGDDEYNCFSQVIIILIIGILLHSISLFHIDKSHCRPIQRLFIFRYVFDARDLEKIEVYVTHDICSRLTRRLQALIQQAIAGTVGSVESKEKAINNLYKLLLSCYIFYFE